MKQIFILLLIIPILSVSQNYKTQKNYISIGFLDHKTGNSLIGYARTIFQNNNNELFLGVGTLIASNTVSIGLKKYLLHSPITCYSVISFQGIYGMGGSSFTAPAISVGAEKKLTKNIFINLGINSTIRFYSSNIGLTSFPQLNLNIRY